MHKIRICLFVCLLLLCSSCGIKKQNQTNGDAKYNSQQQVLSSVAMIESDDGVIAYPKAEGRNDTFFFPISISKDGITSLQDKAYSTCSYTNVDACANLTKAYNVHVQYYEGNIYFYEKRIEVEKRLNYLLNIDIHTANIDMKQKNKAYTINSFGEPVFYEMSYTFANVQFHRGKVYACYNNELYVGDIETTSLKRLDTFEQKSILKVFFDEENMYIYIKKYGDTNGIHKNAVLLCDLNGNVKSILYENLNVMFIDNKNIFFSKKNEQHETTLHVLNQKTKTIKEVDGNAYEYIYKYDETYLLDTMKRKYNVNYLTILDEGANVILKEEYTDEAIHTSGIYMKDVYYVFDYKTNWFGYYEIKDDQISDFNKLNTLS